MPTIKDVARRAGVAPITASRVINNTGYVSDETRARVEAAIDALGYVPNRIARSLRSKRTHTLGLVLTDITNPFWTTVARGVEDAASEDGFNVILCNTDESESKERTYVQVLLQKQVDGFVLVPARRTSESVARIRKQAVPLVVVDREIDAPVDTVRSDSEAGAYRLVRHLLERGHRRIAALSGPQDVSTAAERVAGYRRAMVEADLPVEDAWVHYEAFTQAGGYAMAQAVLDLNPRPTAVFAANNFIALGVLQALRERDVAVPEGMAVIAFDDLPPSFAVEPFLTVAAQRPYEMGRTATSLLLDRLTAEGPQPEPREVILPTQLIVRRSSRAAPTS